MPLLIRFVYLSARAELHWGTGPVSVKLLSNKDGYCDGVCEVIPLALSIFAMNFLLLWVWEMPRLFGLDVWRLRTSPGREPPAVCLLEGEILLTIPSTLNLFVRTEVCVWVPKLKAARRYRVVAAVDPTWSVLTYEPICMVVGVLALLTFVDDGCVLIWLRMRVLFVSMGRTCGVCASGFFNYEFRWFGCGFPVRLTLT